MLCQSAAAVVAGGRLLRSAAREYWLEARIFQDAFHLVTLVTLNFNAACFHPAAYAAGFLDLLGEVLFLRQSDPLEILHDGHRFTAPMCRLTDDVHPPASGVLLAALGCLLRQAR